MNNIKKKNICILGAGKVGSSLMFALDKAGFKKIIVIEKDTKKIKHFKKETNSILFLKKVNQDVINKSDVILISVQDKYLSDTIIEISKKNSFLKNKIFLHTSGSTLSDVFDSIGINKNMRGSFHPLQTFNKISYNYTPILKNIYFGIEGGKNAVSIMKELSKILNAKYIIVNTQDKMLYHSSCVIASNLLVSHFNLLKKLSKRVSLNNKMEYEIFIPIIQSTINNIIHNGIEKSLTGPFERGDYITIENHLKAIKKYSKEILNYYILLGKNAIKISLSKKSINISEARKIDNILNSYKTNR